MVLRIVIKTKTTVDGETSEDYSTNVEIPVLSDFDVYFDNGGLVISGINEANDSANGANTKRDIIIGIEFDRSESKSIIDTCKQAPRLPL